MQPLIPLSASIVAATSASVIWSPDPTQKAKHLATILRERA